jgi:hypothetical protein
MLTIRSTYVTSFLGSAYTVITIQLNARSCAAIDRAIAGPHAWQRLFGLLHRKHSIRYLIRFQSSVPAECVSIWHEYNSKVNGGQLTIHLPQTIGPSDVPPGTIVEILHRQWVPTGDGALHRSNWNPELLEYTCCSVSVPVSSELTSG